ncbi:MAG: hypothetical protein HQL23_03620 [Candidatus Omnitrophica bacterium]|nr:hypothetical protein [Candidatus Omnitrophota bacterium]
MSDEEQYQIYQVRQSAVWEEQCRRCGACCGSVEGDPCECLIAGNDGRYQCAVYANRFGLHRTKSGIEINCVPLREILHKSWPGDQDCVYKKL